MYFPFLNLHGWGKRLAIRPQMIYSDFPKPGKASKNVLHQCVRLELLQRSGRNEEENSCFFLNLWYNKQKYVMPFGVAKV